MTCRRPRTKSPIIAIVAAALAVCFFAAPLAACLFAAAALAAPPDGSAVTSGASARYAATQRATVAISVTGTVYGRGGSGKYAWSVKLSGAQVRVIDSTSTKTNSKGAYTLKARVPKGMAYGYAVVRASKANYLSAEQPLSDMAKQTRTFKGSNALLVKATTLKVTVSSGGGKVAGATVSCFGKSVKTNSSGVATLKTLRLKPGAGYTAKVTKSGYSAASVRFTSKPGGSVVKTATIR
jgi:hypothetical protein